MNEAPEGVTLAGPLEGLEDKTLLLADDDKPFVGRLARAMEARGFQVTIVETVAEGLAAIRQAPPEVAPGGAVAVELYAIDPAGRVRPAADAVSWSLCTAPKPPPENNVVSPISQMLLTSAGRMPAFAGKREG